ncbi:MAG: restriction endonuclease subunit S [Sulfuricurvum sp.]|nr:restriction endonuclease subunit S [Sulfuricurvum sp.]
MTYQLDQQVAERLKAFFEPFDFIDKVVIFGSRAKHNANPKSDIDLCIYSLEMSEAQFSKLKLALDELPILYKIDVVHFEKSNEALRENVSRDGKLLFVKIVKLEDLEYDKSIIVSKGKQLPNEYRDKGEIKVIGAGQKSPYLSSHANYEGNTITISSSGAYAGYVWFHNYPLWASDCTVIKVNKNIDMSYLYLFLKSKQELIYSFQTGAGQPHVYWKNIKNIEIPLPSLTKQQEIAQTLDKASELIALRKASIEKLDELSQSIFIDMFGDPVKNLHNWDIVEFGTVVKIDAPMVDPNTPKYENLLHIGPDRIERNTGKLLPALTAKEEGLISKKFLFDEQYILYSKIRPYLNKVAIVNFIGLCSADMYPIRPILDKTNREYLLQLLLSSYFLKYTETLPDRASIPKLNRKELAKFEFPLPPLELQEKFAQVMQKIESQKSLYEAELTKLQANFDALMAQSFEG